MPDPLIELATRITASERAYTRMSRQCWDQGDIAEAVRWRYIAEGLAEARDHHAAVIAEMTQARTTTTTTEGAPTA